MHIIVKLSYNKTTLGPIPGHVKRLLHARRQPANLGCIFMRADRWSAALQELKALAERMKEGGESIL
jgi:hypothetical protein